MGKTQKPYHIEARELGVVDFKAIKGLNYRRISADQLRTIWNYRAAGLKIDDAREKLDVWNRGSYHEYQRGQKQTELQKIGRAHV